MGCACEQNGINVLDNNSLPCFPPLWASSGVLGWYLGSGLFLSKPVFHWHIIPPKLSPCDVKKPWVDATNHLKIRFWTRFSWARKRAVVLDKDRRELGSQSACHFKTSPGNWSLVRTRKVKDVVTHLLGASLLEWHIRQKYGKQLLSHHPHHQQKQSDSGWMPTRGIVLGSGGHRAVSPKLLGPGIGINSTDKIRAIFEWEYSKNTILYNTNVLFYTKETNQRNSKNSKFNLQDKNSNY